MALLTMARLTMARLTMVQERVLRALVESGKPFAMLLPISVLHVGFVREILDTDEVRDEGMG